MAIKEMKLGDGKRIIIVKQFDGFRIKVQEHESICGGYIADAGPDGWRDCLLSFEYSFDKAEVEMNRLAKLHCPII